MSTTSVPLLQGTKEMTTTKVVATNHTRHPGKIVFAAAMVLAGGYGIFNESQFVSSSDAVVSGYVLNVRTPIDGTVTGMPGTAGRFVEVNQLIGAVSNPLNDNSHLDTMRTVETSAQSNADALAAEHAMLTRQRNELLSRTGTYLNAVGTRLDQQITAADRTLAALKKSLNEANIEYGRGRELHNAGIMSNADFDKLSSTREVLTEEVAAQQAAVHSAQSQASSATKGILTEPGTNSDVAYSRQRADEITEKLAENTRMLISSRAQAQEAHLRVLLEDNRAQGMTQSALRAPITGLLWRLDAVNGEHVSAGDSVLSLIDCSQQFMLAEVPEDRINDIQLGRTAFIRLTGEREERTGTVISVAGDPQHSMDHKLAAFPVQDANKELATVLISLNQSAEEKSANPCAIGRTARVRMPAVPTTLASRWLRRIF
jgi:multidrug resistance efflux pump